MKLDLAVLDTPVWSAGEFVTDAIGVKGDRIVALGDDVTPLIGKRTIKISGAGMACAGFQDAHVHPPYAGRNLCTVDLNDLPGKDAYLEAIKAYADAHPDEEWILGGGWAMEHFPGGTPSKDDLDAIVPDRPVFLLNRDVHGAWVNSAALEAGGIDSTTRDPSDGRIERVEGSNEPQGTLHEGAAYSFQDRVVPAPGQEDWERYLLAAQQHLHSLGVTAWQDAWVTQPIQDAYESLADQGKLTAHVVAALWWDRHRGVGQIQELLARRRHSSYERFRPTTVKIMVDGVIENRTSAMLTPYNCGCGGDRGLTYVPQGVLDPAVRELAGNGFQLHLHAIGDRAVRLALDALAGASRDADQRHTIAHVQVINPDDLQRFSELGVVVNAQTYWAQREPQMDELTVPVLGDERSAQQYPFRSLIESGARLAMGSDWGVTTANPLEQIEVAVRRVDPENRDNEPFLPDESLDLGTALDAFTRGSAYVNHDDDAGVIEVGKRADIVVLDKNLFELEFASDASVTRTIASGKVVYKA